MRPPLRLLASDIDGTLLNSKFCISDRDLAALRDARRRGIEIVLVTGRRHQFALPVARELGFDLWIISSNGAITRSLSGETFHRDPLPRSTCLDLCSRMREFRACTVLTFDVESRGAIVIEQMHELGEIIARWFEKNLPYIDFVVPLEDALTSDPVQAMFCGTTERMREVLSRLDAPGLREHISWLRTEYPARNLTIVDILNRGCSKGHALARWAEHRGIGRDEVMAIGDNYNDIEMLAFAGRPFIMGNATPELRNRGWAEAPTNDQDGVAAAIDQALGVSSPGCSD